MIVKGIEFHDLPVRGIEFDFGSKELIISCESYNEKTKDYDPIKIYFGGVNRIFTDLMEIDEPFNIDIAHVDYIQEGENQKAEILFLTGFSKAGMLLSFNFASVHYSW